MTVSARAVVFIRTSLYVAIFITSFIIFVPLAISMGKCDGSCLLYSERKSGSFFMYGTQSNCNFVLSISIIFNLILALLLTGSGVLTLIGKLNPLSDLTSVAFLVNVIVDGLACFLIFVASCIFSVGLKEACDTMTHGIVGCSSASITVSGGDRYSFYGNMSTAQAALWVSCFLWLAELGVALFTLWRLGKLCCGQAQTSSTTETPNQQIPSTDPNKF